jgi:hypothetical protein
VAPADEAAVPAAPLVATTAPETKPPPEPIAEKPAEAPAPVAPPAAPTTAEPAMAAVVPPPAPTNPEPTMAGALAPPAPTAPAMAGGESLIPSGTPGLPLLGEAPAAAPGLIPPSTARTSVILTKPIEITLPFGKISVPAGTPVKIVSKSGSTLTVRYLTHEVSIPASSTDLGTDPAPAAAPALLQ